MCRSSTHTLVVSFISMDNLQDSEVSTTIKNLSIVLDQSNEYDFFIKIGKLCYLSNRKVLKTENISLYR